MTGEEKAVIQEEEEETFERVDGFYLEVEYKGDIYIHSRLERHNKLFLFFRCLASWWVTWHVEILQWAGKSSKDSYVVVYNYR